MKNNIQKKVVAYIPEVLLPAELETIKNTLKVWWETLLEDDDIESSVPKDLPLTISESKGKITLTVSIEPQTAANKRKKPENKERVGAIIVYDKNKHSHIFLKVF